MNFSPIMSRTGIETISAHAGGFEATARAVKQVLEPGSHGATLDYLARCDDAQIRKALLACEPGQVKDRCIAFANALQTGNRTTQSSWRAVVDAASHAPDADWAGLVDDFATRLSDLNSQDLVLWGALQALAAATGEPDVALNVVATKMAEALVEASSSWEALISTALRLPGAQKENLLAQLANVLSTAIRSPKGTRVSNMLVGAIASVNATARFEYCGNVANYMASAKVDDPQLWQALLDVAERGLRRQEGQAPGPAGLALDREGEQSDHDAERSDRDGELSASTCDISDQEETSRRDEVDLSACVEIATHLCHGITDDPLCRRLVAFIGLLGSDEVVADLCKALAGRMASENFASAATWGALLALESVRENKSVLQSIAGDLVEESFTDTGIWSQWADAAMAHRNAAKLLAKAMGRLLDLPNSVEVVRALLGYADRLEERDRFALVQGIAAHKSCAIELIWSELLLRASRLQPNDCRALLNTLATRLDIWSALLDHADTLADRARSQLLAGAIPALSDKHDMRPEIWSRICSSSQERGVLASVIRSFVIEVQRAEPSPDGKVTNGGVEARAAALKAYAACEALLVESLVGMGEFSAPFKALEPVDRLHLLRNLSRLEEAKSPYAGIYAQMLKNAIASGSLALDSIDEVAEIRRKIKLDPDWQFDAQPSAAFCTDVPFGEAVQHWEAQMKVLLDALAQTLANIPLDKSRRKLLDSALAKVFKPALLVISRDTEAIKAGRYNALLDQAFGRDRQRSNVGRELLEALLIKRNGVVTIKPHVEKSLGDLFTFAGSKVSELASQVKSCQDAWDELRAMVANEHFSKRYDELYIFTVKPLPKDDLSSLMVGREVGCCLSHAGGTHFEAMLERLVSLEWIPIVLQEGKSTIAAVWGVLARLEAPAAEKPVRALLGEFVDMKPSYAPGGNSARDEAARAFGDGVMAKLLDTLPQFARAFGASETWIGKQRYGRLQGLESLQRPSFIPMKWTIAGAQHVPRQRFYTDNIDPENGEGAFARLDPTAV